MQNWKFFVLFFLVSFKGFWQNLKVTCPRWRLHIHDDENHIQQAKGDVQNPPNRTFQWTFEATNLHVGNRTRLGFPRTQWTFLAEKIIELNEGLIPRMPQEMCPGCGSAIASEPLLGPSFIQLCILKIAGTSVHLLGLLLLHFHKKWTGGWFQFCLTPWSSFRKIHSNGQLEGQSPLGCKSSWNIDFPKLQPQAISRTTLLKMPVARRSFGTTGALGLKRWSDWSTWSSQRYFPRHDIWGHGSCNF